MSDRNDTASGAIYPSGPGDPAAWVARLRAQGEADRWRAARREAALWALEQLARGIREEPPGSNRGAAVDAINLGVDGTATYLLGAPWCARWARRAAEAGCRRAFGIDPERPAAALPGGEAPTPFAECGDLASTTKWREAALKHGWWRTAPAPFDVGLLEGHTVVVVTVVPYRNVGVFVGSVEGNHHDALTVVERPVEAFKHGFVRWGDASTPQRP